jgi:hypothetical protein
MIHRICILSGVLATLACNGDLVEPTSPSSFRLAVRAAGDLRRPAVVMDHARHAKAVGKENCDRCHRSQQDGTLELAFAGTSELNDPDELMSLYHDECIGCHRDDAVPEGAERGPIVCGGCHVEGPERPSLRVAPRWDYSLHARHAKAEKDQCVHCHHVYDEESETLVYVKGEESACRDCHSAVAEGRTRSLRKAAHRACIDCHRERGKEGGPTSCAGCHDETALAGITVLPEPPMIDRGQPRVTRLAVEGARFLPVRFDHAAHEPLADSCSDCHHQTLAACSACHTVGGSERGGWVTLEAAYHDARATQSCVGCHAEATQERVCAGCHADMAAGPAERTCTTCHRSQDPAPLELAPLPETSDAFPDTVTIDVLNQEYRPSTLPHAAIVGKLDAAIRASTLAATFHGDTAVLCAGCHHHSPVGEKPPACRSCHSQQADPTEDRPGLQAAYHRRCIGCHEQMHLETACTACHEEVSR